MSDGTDNFEVVTSDAPVEEAAGAEESTAGQTVDDQSSAEQANESTENSGSADDASGSEAAGDDGATKDGEKAAAEDAEKGGEESGEENDEQKPRGRFQRRISELTTDRDSALKRAEAAEKLLQEQSAQKQEQQPEGRAELDPADFDSFEAYTAEANKQSSQPPKPSQQASQNQGPPPELVNGAKTIGASVKAWKEAPSDFEEKVSNPNLPVSVEMVSAVAETENPAAVMYHLASNPDAAQDISALNPVQQALEIGRIEAKLATKAPAPKETKAPKPIKPVGSTSAAAKDQSDMSFGEYEKSRKKEGAGKRFW